MKIFDFERRQGGPMFHKLFIFTIFFIPILFNAHAIENIECKRPGEMIKGKIKVTVNKGKVKKILSIPPNSHDVKIQSASKIDIDLNLFDHKKKKIFGWPDGSFASPDEVLTNYKNVTLKWSGFSGDEKGPGNEWITIEPKFSKTINKFTVGVYGHESGKATVTYQLYCAKKQWQFKQKPKIICMDRNWPPTIAAGGSNYIIGCTSNNDEKEIPGIKIVNSKAQIIHEHTLKQSNGNEYHRTSLSSFNGRFQAIYSYNCKDDGSYEIGWGWSCLDFREYSFNGNKATSPIIYGQDGLNGHPVLAWSGTNFITTWVNYDKILFRGIGADRNLIGKYPNKNNLLMKNPENIDERNNARTKIIWNKVKQEFGVFIIMSNKMYLIKLEKNGIIKKEKILLFNDAYSQAYGGEFNAFSMEGDYFVTYYSDTKKKTILTRISSSKNNSWKKTIRDGHYYFPSTFIKNNLIYFINTDSNYYFGQVQVYDSKSNLIKRLSSLIGNGRKMIYPQATFQQRLGTIGVAFQNTEGNVLFGELVFK